MSCRRGEEKSGKTGGVKENIKARAQIRTPLITRWGEKIRQGRIARLLDTDTPRRNSHCSLIGTNDQQQCKECKMISPTGQIARLYLHIVHCTHTHVYILHTWGGSKCDRPRLTSSTGPDRVVICFIFKNTHAHTRCA